MTKRLWILGVTLAGCCCLLARLPAVADSKDETPPPDSIADDVANIAMASRLAEWGLDPDNKSPLAVITAASILRKIKTKEGTIKPKSEGTADAAVAYDDKAMVKESDRLLDEAVKLAKGDRAIKDLADKVRKGTTRGGLNGPMQYQMWLRPGQTDTFNLKFKKGAWVRISTRQTGSCPLHLEAHNVQGVLRSSDQSANPTLGWMPHQTDGSDFTVTVTNRGPTRTFYYLFTN
jgi:hypothetical protein